MRLSSISRPDVWLKRRSVMMMIRYLWLSHSETSSIDLQSAFHKVSQEEKKMEKLDDYGSS